MSSVYLKIWMSSVGFDIYLKSTTKQGNVFRDQTAVHFKYSLIPCSGLISRDGISAEAKYRISAAVQPICHPCLCLGKYKSILHNYMKCTVGSVPHPSLWQLYEDHVDNQFNNQFILPYFCRVMPTWMPWLLALSRIKLIILLLLHQSPRRVPIYHP